MIDYVKKLMGNYDSYVLKSIPILSQEEYDNLPKIKKILLTCNGCGKKVVVGNTLFCVECGIKLREGTFPQVKSVVNEVIVE